MMRRSMHRWFAARIAGRLPNRSLTESRLGDRLIARRRYGHAGNQKTERGDERENPLHDIPEVLVTATA